MELKKIIAYAIFILIIIQSLALPVSAVNGVKIEQILPIIPEINIVIKPELSTNETISKEQCFAKFGNESLIVKSMEKFDSAKHKSTVYFLVDSSNSISSYYLKEIKRKLISYSDNLPETEKMVLISFGLDVETLLAGNESKDIRRQKINSLTVNEEQTNLLNAIQCAVDLSQSETSVSSDRSYAVVISDGENYETGGGNTQQETLETVSGHGLPIYALCVGASNSDASEFGSLARKSGGKIFAAHSPAETGTSFDELIADSKNVYLVSTSTKINQDSTGNQKTLMVRIGDKSTSVDIKPTRWIKDEQAPTILKSESIKDDNGNIKQYIYFSENVLNADNPENFIISRKNKKTDYTFSEAEYFFENGEYYTILTSKKELPKHNDYIITTKNITDSSNERNILSTDNSEFNFGLRSELLIFMRNYMWIVSIPIILAAIAVGLLLYFKKNLNNKNQANDIQNFEADANLQKSTTRVQENYDYSVPAATEKHHIISPSGKPITFKINDGKSLIRTVKTTISSKIIVGRSDDCNIYLDDLKMSRFHFEIELVNGKFWINDLSSANGTYLNNIKITGKRKLKTNDVIIAGQATFTVIFCDK